jgi:hypothetical protein
VVCRGGTRSLGVGKGVVAIKEKGEGEESGKGLGLLLSPSMPTEYDKGKNFSKILRIQRGDSQQLPFPPFGRLRRIKRERKEWFGV